MNQKQSYKSTNHPTNFLNPCGYNKINKIENAVTATTTMENNGCLPAGPLVATNTETYTHMHIYTYTHIPLYEHAYIICIYTHVYPHIANNT